MSGGVGFKLELNNEPSADDLSAISAPLTAFNTADVGPADRQALAILIRDADGKAIGGLSGHTAWGWLYTQLLFVPEALRGQGMAGKLLAKAEAEAIRRGCVGAWIDTFNPQALRAYQCAGYEIFGELPEFVSDRTRSFLRKSLVA